MRHNTGFTLIELMIVAAVIAILAAIALPAFNEQVRKSRRSDAMANISEAALQLEKWRASNPSYSGYTVPSSLSTTFYTVALGDGATGSAYTITATPKGAQSTDRCGTFTYAFSAGTVSKSAGESDCW